MKFVVSYNLPYRHIVSVAIESCTEEEAIRSVEDAFDEGRLGLDVDGMKVIYDEFDEADDMGDVLEFTAETVDAFPEEDASVKAMRDDALGRRCLELIRSARKVSDNGIGSIDLRVLTQVERLVHEEDGKRTVLSSKPELTVLAENMG